MSFGYADVKDAVGQFALHDIHAATTGHSRRNAHHTLVFVRQLEQLVAKHFLP